MRTLSIDFETYSEVDIGKCGSYRYIEDPSFEILLMAYSWDGEPAKVVDLAFGETMPPDVVEGLFDPAVEKHAWNCQFERACLKRYFGREFPAEEWVDVMIVAAGCGLPLSLAGACDVLNLGEDQAKMKEGKALIKYFCCPCKPTRVNGMRTRNYFYHDPEKWGTFKAYCTRDVDAEEAIWQMLKGYRLSETEQRLWCLDARINDRGIPFDRELAEAAVRIDTDYKERLTEEAIQLTGMENPKSVSQIKEWLMEQEGLEVPSLNKKAVADVVSQLTQENTKRFMDLRKEISKTSVKKYETMLRSACSDDRIRGTMQFYGASKTGRWAGRMLQIQNLPQNHLADLDLARYLVKQEDVEAIDLLFDEGISNILSQLIRTALTGGEGKQLLVSDFSAIEARTLAWLAGEQWRLDAFEQGKDIYCVSAEKLYGVPVEKHGQNSHLRQYGKVAELGLGYSGGVNALKAFGADKLGMDDEQLGEIVGQWREASPNIVRFWKALENAAIKAVTRKTSVKSSVGGIWFNYASGILWMCLPSGRRIPYWDCRYGPSLRHKGQKTLSYMGVDQKTRKWTRIETYSGRLAENCTQAVARDILAEKLLALDAAGFEILFSVHDEVVIAEPLGGRSVEDVNAIMNQPIPWCEGLPLRGDGYSCFSYRKD